MPNRILQERICVSETIAELSAEEERFFYRLMVQCDDFGRFDGRASVIRAKCFALQLDRVADEHVAAWLARLVEVGLVITYVVEGRQFLRVTTWARYQQTRAKRSKYPNPETDMLASEINGYQMPAYVPVSGIRETINEKRLTRSGGDARAPAPAPAPEGSCAPPTPASLETGHDQILDVPAAVADFHAVLVGTQGYEPSPALFDQITERYGSLDLRQQALKIRSWLADPTRNRRQRSATAKFILGWFEREVSGDGLPAATANDRGSAPPKQATSWAESFQGRHGYHSNATETPHAD